MLNGDRLQCETFDEVVVVLGGTGAVGRLCDDQDSAAVCNWKRRRGRFPTKYHKVMMAELRKKRATAPDHLWGFVEKKKKR
jgi:hypothetical protein